MNKRQWMVFCAVAALAVAIPAAQAAPNLSGTWKLNAAKSDYGPIPPPDKMDRKITHEDPSLKMTTTQTGQQGEITTELAYTTDGKPSTNKTPRGEVTGTAKWDGDVLVIDSKRKIQDMDISSNERWSVSEDGKTLTITTKLNTPQGDFEVKQVLEKQ